MIRINLLPQAKRASGGSAAPQVWGGIYVGAILLWVVVLAFAYWSRSSELNQEEATNAEIKQQVARVKAESGDLDEIQKKLDRSQQLENVVQELLDARQGPAQVLMELSDILSPGGGPTIDPKRLEALRRTNPQAGYNRGWDPRRLWLKKFEERERSCNIVGVGKTNEDVAEFLRRLSLSRMFANVELKQTRATREKEAEMIGFILSCEVRY